MREAMLLTLGEAGWGRLASPAGRSIKHGKQEAARFQQDWGGAACNVLGAFQPWSLVFATLVLWVQLSWMHGHELKACEHMNEMLVCKCACFDSSWNDCTIMDKKGVWLPICPPESKLPIIVLYFISEL